ncbi:MAG: phosphate ABC transporter substrate-binding protein, partial [Pseudanabaenales cyanobacterium]|nr:phosphate ABC transporter substrate-binding protein [Pseudanabaenales cyanobacterium]
PLVQPNACPAQRNQLNTTVFQQGDYPITRRLFVIVKQNNQTDQQAGEAYARLILTSQGQELISKVGFVSIR